jgi:hypothetical protein
VGRSFVRRLFLDDERATPEGYERVYTAGWCIHKLQTERWDVVSLDHDLGDAKNGTGYDVLCWIERETFTNPNYFPPKIFIHSANPSAVQKMELGAKCIQQIIQNKVDAFLS